MHKIFVLVVAAAALGFAAPALAEGVGCGTLETVQLPQAVASADQVTTTPVVVTPDSSK